MKLNLIFSLIFLSSMVFGQDKLSESAFLHSLNDITTTEKMRVICNQLNNHLVDTDDYLNLFVTALESSSSPYKFINHGCKLPAKNKSKNLQKNVDRLARIKGLRTDFKKWAIDNYDIDPSSIMLPVSEIDRELTIIKDFIDNWHGQEALMPEDINSEIDNIVSSHCLGGVPEIPLPKFQEIFAQIFVKMGDTHTKISPRHYDSLNDFLPFHMKLTKLNGKMVVVPLKIDTRGEEPKEVFANESHPILSEINGVSVETLIEKMKEYIHIGVTESRLIDQLPDFFAHVGFFYQKVTGKRLKSPVKLKFTNEEGKSIISETSLSNARPQGIRASRDPESRSLTPNTSYFKVTGMWGEGHKGIEALHQFMQKNKNRENIIIDLRDSSGGTRDMFKHIFPYFMKDKFMVATAGLCRKAHSSDPNKYLNCLKMGIGGRELHQINDPIYTEEERKFLRTKKITVNLPKNAAEYDSEPAYQLIRRDSNPRTFPYQGNVTFLMGTNNFSATDAFLGGLREMSHITKIGQPSNGGSGARKEYFYDSWIGGSRGYRLSRVLSLHPNGEIIEGKSVQPDIEVYPSLKSLIGEEDNVLDKALDLLR